ncbi:MAG TPA: PfkB family carbohydrate kinase [Plantibacter sp.]|uniref:carbohydrate kinase family protein n=1 Tax=unclassified Plantibacter TaxID=2624265 RepID=UPI002CB5400C|nr:PfkB family carbohydrate kinase [Plantibacter sp.]
MVADNTRVVVIGDALIDEFRDETGSRDFVGGAALNVAVGLSVLGVPTTLIAMIGDDVDGARIRAFLDQHGVELVATVGPNGSSRAISDRTDGEPRYEFNEAAWNRAVDFGDAEHAAIDAASLVVVSCFPFDDVAQTAALEAAVADAPSRLVIDPNPRAGMLHSAERFLDGFRRLAASSLIVKVGDDDADLLAGEALAAFVERLIASGASAVLGTAGRDGAFVRTASIEVARPIADLPGPVVDTMGGGDATLASSVASVREDGLPADAAAWGVLLEDAMIIAAATCRSEGALLRTPALPA